jgi:hypothetical protein
MATAKHRAIDPLHQASLTRNERERKLLLDRAAAVTKADREEERGRRTN